jgi:nitronate monooxygenase
MGVAVSDWQLARAVSSRGHLGVISGTMIAVVMARRLQLGDPGGHIRRALENFPLPGVAERLLGQWFVPGGKAEDAPFKEVEMPTITPSRELTELTIASNFVEVWLAKEGQSGVVGINLLEKIQLPTLASLYGAMLAGVDYVLMGAGIPRTIPGILDLFAKGEAAELAIDVTGAAEAGLSPSMRLDPFEWWQKPAPALKRPYFLAIISSTTLALTLAKKASGKVDGFVVEGVPAGGHNAPPRGSLILDDAGEPIYGPRDAPDLDKIRAIGLPFWLAGSCATAEELEKARATGAQGVQVGTAFAFSDESGIIPEIKVAACSLSAAKKARIFTDPFASPTGFPFKLLQIPGSISDDDCYQRRTRLCDLGYLREPFVNEKGEIDYRCAGEPVGNYVRKGGEKEDTTGRKCLCNGLLSTIGLGQIRRGRKEPAMITAGQDATQLSRYLKPGLLRYGVTDVLKDLGLSEKSPSAKPVKAGD